MQTAHDVTAAETAERRERNAADAAGQTRFPEVADVRLDDFSGAHFTDRYPRLFGAGWMTLHELAIQCAERNPQLSHRQWDVLLTAAIYGHPVEIELRERVPYTRGGGYFETRTVIVGNVSHLAAPTAGRLPQPGHFGWRTWGGGTTYYVDARLYDVRAPVRQYAHHDETGQEIPDSRISS